LLVDALTLSTVAGQNFRAEFRAMQTLEEGLEEVEETLKNRAMGVDECVAAVMALTPDEVAKIQQKLMQSLFKG
jgi:hypothetical protein